MISLEQIAREKVRIEQVFPMDELIYDHEKQRCWEDDNFDARRIYMKSSTMFDGERDKGGDDR